MRFLVLTGTKVPLPPEMALAITEATEGWVAKHKASGKMEQVWGFAGLQGGGGIANVDSLDELDAMMKEFPFAPFSDIDIRGLVDFEATMRAVKQSIQAMAPPQ
jgi:muconolactone delta-isomerase